MSKVWPVIAGCHGCEVRMVKRRRRRTIMIKVDNERERRRGKKGHEKYMIIGEEKTPGWFWVPFLLVMNSKKHMSRSHWHHKANL